MNYFYDLFIVLGFLSVFLLLEGIYLAWNAYRGTVRKNIARRLRIMSAESGTAEVSLLKREHRLSGIPILERLLRQTPFIGKLDLLLMQSGFHLTVAALLGLMLLLGAIAFFLSMLAGLHFYIASMGGVLFFCLPLLYLVNAGNKRLHNIENQLPDAMDLISRAMRAGHAFPSAMKMVRDEMPEPIAGEFGIAFDEINYGISVQDALTNLSQRVPSTDMRYFVISVLVQRQTGGNLTELLSNISALIRSRLKLLGTVRVLATEGRLSAWILGILPFAVALAINIINPGFMSLLWTDPAGMKVTAATLFMMIVGIYWMWRIVKIRI